MEEQIDNSEKSILKGISLFGGVQIIQMLVSLVRGKFVAMILGPEGIGINTLFNSSQTTIQVFGSLGLNLAIVKEISSNRDNPPQLSLVMAVAWRLIFWSAIFGALLCFLLSPVLSRITFGSYGQTVSFMFLSISLFFSIAAAGKLSILQGLHQVKKLSRASLVGALAGLLIGVPLYYLFGIKGIVPAIICVTAAMYFFYSFTLKRCKLPAQETVRLSANKPLVRKLLSVGFILVAGNLAATSVTYIINLFIRTFGDIENVGYFQAANSITMQYMGMVFAAMAVE
ncbi:MAG: oligosaccharide flippase family protein [Paramuribaculum sp.]|nr:oligosaccharide flippase family protein [Paramuribaculum sp.]